MSLKTQKAKKDRYISIVLVGIVVLVGSMVFASASAQTPEAQTETTQSNTSNERSERRARQYRKWARKGYRGCRTSACASRVKRKRIARAGFEGCRTWKCVKRVQRKRAARLTRAVTPPGMGVLNSIASCESGGNPRAVSPNGFYRGKYQFDRPTWRSVGGSGDPAAAPEEEQDRRAAMLYRRRGSSPWPICGR